VPPYKEFRRFIISFVLSSGCWVAPPPFWNKYISFFPR